MKTFGRLHFFHCKTFPSPLGTSRKRPFLVDFRASSRAISASLSPTARALFGKNWLTTKPSSTTPTSGRSRPVTWLEIVTYTPSKEPQEIQEFFGRRQLRIMNGQLPVYHAYKFTPEPNLVKFVWPTNAEAEAWAEAAKKSRAKRSLGAALRDTPVGKKAKESPETAAAAGQQPEEAAIAASPVPFGLA